MVAGARAALAGVRERTKWRRARRDNADSSATDGPAARNGTGACSR
jgi:hypothetical protein